MGKERFNRKEVRDQIKGSVKTLGYGGAAYAGYSAGDFISDFLGDLPLTILLIIL